jgi:predicted HTH transcriptional regulator
MKKTHNHWITQIQQAFSSRRETNEVDFKLMLSSNTDRLKEHINAFGNSDDGGVLVFGVADNFEPAFSTPALFKQQEAIAKATANLATDSQVPPLTVENFSVTLAGKEHLCLYIHPGSESPVFIKDRSPLGGGGCFKRSGTSTIPMPINEIRERIARSKNFYYDETPLEELGIDDLDFQSIEQIFKDFRASDRESSRNIGVLLENNILTGDPGRYSVTIAGWLVFAKDPQAYRQLRNVHIEFQQFRSSTREEPLKKMTITGPIYSQVEQAIDVLLQHVWVMPTIQGSRRVEIPSYDKTILREVIANSIVHRDYSKMYQPVKIALFTDRLEIENPGGLLPGLTPFNLIHKREWRNPSLAQLLEKFRIGEMDGQGIDRLYSATRRIKLPAPQFFDNHSSFKVVLSGPKNFDAFTPEEKRLSVQVMLILEDTVDNEGVRNAFDIDTLRASTLIKSLVEDGVIRSTTKSRKFARYQLTQEYRQRIFG